MYAKAQSYMLKRILVENLMINMVMLLKQDKRVDDCYLDVDEEPVAITDIYMQHIVV